MRILLLALALAASPAAAQEKEAAVTGRVMLAVPAPKPKPERAMEADPKCACLHAKLPPREDLVTDAEGGLKWAFVYVKKGLEGKTFPVPSTPALLDQQGCLYVPRVVGVMAGQTLNIRNSDAMLHNVNALAFANKGFNLAQPLQGQVNAVTFTTPEVMIPIVCNVHGWMKTFVGVVDHPFHAVTDASGRFAIKGLPPGTYTLGVWQEKCLAREAEIEVKGGETKLPDLVLERRPE
jgi:plastocyanin